MNVQPCSASGKGHTKKSVWLFVFLLVLPTTSLLHPVDSVAQHPPEPEGRRFRAIVADKYPRGSLHMGGTTGWKKRPGGAGVTIDREFGYVTPENDFKQSTVHPMPDVWNWELADKWVAQSAKQNQVLRIHGPVGPQCSRWTKDDSRTSAELRANLIEYMTALSKRYNRDEHVVWLDVVNEVVLRDGSWHGPKQGTDEWENPWLKLGYDKQHELRPPLFVKLAFEVANRHATKKKLIINQHGDMQETMWDKVKALVPYLREQGLRVDGIGWQAHIDVGWENVPGNVERLNDLIQWAHANDLSFHVTEQNVWLRGKEKDYQAQADTFGAIVHALLKNRRSGVVTWNVWNLSDGDAWEQVKDRDGSLFDRQYRPKPAYYRIQRLLENPPTPFSPR